VFRKKAWSALPLWAPTGSVVAASLAAGRFLGPPFLFVETGEEDAKCVFLFLIFLLVVQLVNMLDAVWTRVIVS
jgi:hypothetical protein